jgi:dUTP pyrophosphatase
MEFEIRILDDRLHEWGFPSFGSEMAAGLDLHACLDEPLLLQPQAAPMLIPTGFAIRLGDPNWSALILPRSGLGHKNGLVLGNSVGVVDADYEGTCYVSAWNRNPASCHGDVVERAQAPIEIKPGDRIAQMIFVNVTRPTLRCVTSFDGKSLRGNQGFGSTGVDGLVARQQSGAGSGAVDRGS